LDEYQKRARDKAKFLLARIEEKRNSSVSIDSLNEQLKTCDRHSSNVRAEIDQHNTRHTQVYDALNQKRSAFQVRFGDLKDVATQLNQLIKDQSAAQKRIRENEKRIQANQDEVISAAQKAEPLLKSNIRALTEKIKDGKAIDIAKINCSLVTGRTKERVLRDQVQALEKALELGIKCPTCRKPLTKQEIERLHQVRQEELEQAKKLHAETRTKLQSAERKAQELQAKFDSATKAEVEKGKLELKLAKYASSLTAALKENEQLIQANKELASKDYATQIQELKNRASRDEASKSELELQNLEHEVTTLRTMIDRLNIEYGSLIKSKENLTKQILQQHTLQEELNKLNAEYATYDKLRDYFGKDGIQSVIIENVIDELETYTNDVLAKICNELTTVSIKTQKQSDNGNWQESFEIEVCMGGRTDDLLSFSGGEQFRVSMALRLALSRILAKRMGGTLKFLLLDEVDSSLDDKGIDLFINIIKQLGTEMKVLIISHSERIKGFFDDIIVINKTANGSNVAIENY
jgi:exonuclease SbcC